MYKIAIIFTCFNRVNTTRRFLKSLNDAFIPAELNLEVFGLDDGSSDGTYNELIIHGVKAFKSNGSEYWAGGMRKIISKIDLKKYDFVLCVNDDIVLNFNVFDILLNTIREHSSNIRNSIFVASCYSNNRLTYGSVHLQKKYYGYRLHLSHSQDTLVNTFNMNFTLIPTDIIRKFGFLDEVFTHHWADFDYGIRMTSKGVNIIQIHDHICNCDRDMSAAGSFDMSYNFTKRLKLFLGPKEQLPAERWIFYKRHGGFLWILGFLSSYFLFFFPRFRLYLKKLKQSNYLL